MIVLISIVSCGRNEVVENEKDNQNGFVLEKESDSLHWLCYKQDSLSDCWELPYPVYQFQVGDVNEDGVEDALVGVEKTTRFDSVMGRRLFIFKNYKGLVRPLWLGSRLSQPLEDFKLVHSDSKPYIRSIELEKNGNYLVAEYKWRKFGLEFVRYIQRDISFIEAQKQLTLTIDK